ncbi:MAG: NADH-quinone oxidoreductase subunit NuoH [Acidobacteriota bacterium]|nr:NADH-quinone oxidoreductase subunit NuoH [Blastocatellia bacterium]MDW8238379.1 NADH-quinone oxidoreductase subunit NuoH [Acidobacteriota bacterium]
MNIAIEATLKIVVALFVIMTTLAYLVLIERKVLAWIQYRVGPNRVGPWGLLQPLADLLKFLAKEDVTPDTPNKILFTLAPLLSFVPAMMTLAVIPFGGSMTLFGQEIGLYITTLNVGVLYILALGSLEVYGVVLAGWASNSKYALLGGLRSAAQMISYELALTLSVVGVLIQAGTLDLQQIVQQQAGTYLGFIPRWYVFWYQPLGFLIFFIAAVAETNRVPFDLPEAETELVAGYHTEYSSIKFAIFFVAEYAAMFAVSSLATTLFLGGWNGPGADRVPLLGVVYFALKVGALLFVYIWLRGTLPRFRYDQLMRFGWKFLVPMAMLNIVISAVLALW